jgi:hypothetical protein
VTAADRPWWSSPDGDLDADADVDPVEVHRRARRGESSMPDGGDASDDPRPVDDGSWWVPATEAVTRLARDLAATAGTTGGPHDPGTDPGRGEADHGQARGDGRRRGGGGGGGSGESGGGDGGGAAHRIDACGICPICVGLRALGEARPDLVAHLAEAARHLALAVRTVVDAAAEPGEAADPGAPRGARRRPRHDDLQHIDLDDG